MAIELLLVGSRAKEIQMQGEFKTTKKYTKLKKSSIFAKADREKQCLQTSEKAHFHPSLLVKLDTSHIKVKDYWEDECFCWIVL